MLKQNIYTETSWIKLTPYKGKNEPFYTPIGELFSEEKGGNLVPPSDIESPQKVLKTLWPEFNIKKIEPFCGIRTGANIWEYYLLRMHECSVERYNRLKLKPSKTFEYNHERLKKTRLGFTYNLWKDRYKGIKNETLKKASFDFISALKKKTGALRQNDGDLNYIKNRQKAAEAFFKYLTNNKKSIANDLSKCGTLYEILETMIKKEKNQERKRHLYCISLMLCLYGRKDEANVSCNLAKIVYEKIVSFENNLAVEICAELKKVSKNFKKNFKPPFANIYGYYQDKATILFRLTTWLTLVEATSKARKEK